MTPFKNPWPLVAYIISIVAIVMAVFCIFVNEARSADWHSQLKPPAATYKLAPCLTCWGHKEADDIEHNIQVFKDNDTALEVLEDIRPYDGYDGYIQFLLTNEDGTQELKEWRWVKKDLLLCELLKQKLPKPSNS